MLPLSQKSNTTDGRVETNVSTSESTSFPPSQESKNDEDTQRTVADILTKKFRNHEN